jgi:pimeloyl-ACP methyl ester carboxylesterase
MPTLILHGEYDSLIPVTEAQDLWANSAARRKPLVIINGAEHNDILLVGLERYFAEITEFIFGE